MIDYRLASSSWGNEEIDAINSVIKKGMYSMGDCVKEFESDFSRFFGCKYSVMVSSGSTANLIMIASLFYKKENPLKRGDTVIVPAVSWSTSYYPLYQYGLKIKFVDIDLETLNYDLKNLISAVTPDVKAILAVNLLGNNNDFSVISKIAHDNNIYLLEDNCESMGSSFNGKFSGTYGLMGTFSCFFSHHISTMEGGVVVTDDEELYHILLCLRAHGWTRNLPKFNHVTGEKSDDPFEESFKFVLPGYNVRPLEMSGAIGIEQLKKLPEFITARKENANFFVQLFRNHPHFIIQKEIGESSWFGFSFIIKESSNLRRKDVVRILSENGVEVRPIVTGNFAKNEVVKWFDYEIHGELSNADLLDSNGFFVGNHQFDIKDKISQLFELLNKIG
ncbi:MAG: DegT/DnrJ/EryC1/StrS family aminotransferase [Spirochaetales bacterium]|nr:DegT/DnrJ/EryC1/StrS family aminotransferase [Spirochaetales bacterium]